MLLQGGPDAFTPVRYSEDTNNRALDSETDGNAPRETLCANAGTVIVMSRALKRSESDLVTTCIKAVNVGCRDAG